MKKLLIAIAALVAIGTAAFLALRTTMIEGQLSDFALTVNETGWTSKFPGGPHLLFGKEIRVQIDTRLGMNEPGTPPPISSKQAALVHTLVPALPGLLKKVEEVLVDYNKEHPDFREFVKDPQVWLNCDKDDGVTWAFVVERSDWPSFGYHAEFKGTNFVEIWAGD